MTAWTAGERAEPEEPSERLATALRRLEADAAPPAGAKARIRRRLRAHLEAEKTDPDQKPE